MLRLHNIVGAASEALVMAYLASEAFEVYAPLSPHSRADLAYRRDGKLLGVQVKTASWHKGTMSEHRYENCRVSDRRTKQTYSPEEVDELWVVGTHLWRFPVAVIQGKQNLTLNSTNPEPRKTARDYDPEEFVEVFGSIDRPFRDRWRIDDPNPTRFTTNTQYTPDALRQANYRTRKRHEHA